MSGLLAQLVSSALVTFFGASLPKVSVLSYNEVVPARTVETLSIVRMEDEA